MAAAEEFDGAGDVATVEAAADVVVGLFAPAGRSMSLDKGSTKSAEIFRVVLLDSASLF